MDNITTNYCSPGLPSDSNGSGSENSSVIHCNSSSGSGCRRSNDSSVFLSMNASTELNISITVSRTPISSDPSFSINSVITTPREYNY